MRYIAVLIFLLASRLAHADAPPLDDPWLDRLAGHWVLSGTIAGEQTTHDVHGEWIAGHQYLQLVERSRETQADGRPAYEAMILLGRNIATGEYQCQWLDSTGGGALGDASTGRGMRVGESVRFEWRDAGVVSLANTFRHDAAADAWTWDIDNIQDGAAVPFGRVRLTRP